MKALYLVFLLTLTSCGYWDTFVAEVNTIDRVAKRLAKPESAYRIKKIKKCTKTWFGTKKCETKQIVVRKDGRRLTPRENRELNGD